MPRALCAWLLAGLAGCSCTPRGQDHALESRAGYPSRSSPCASPSDDGSYVAYRVGGGATCGGDAPGPEDGTWGWDYLGCHFSPQIVLGWWHGRQCQGGSGAYNTDGPRPCEEHKEKKEE